MINIPHHKEHKNQPSNHFRRTHLQWLLHPRRLAVDERVGAPSRLLSSLRRLRLGVVVLHIALQTRTTWRPHWSFRLVFVGQVHHSTRRRGWWRSVPSTGPCAVIRTRNQRTKALLSIGAYQLAMTT